MKVDSSSTDRRVLDCQDLLTRLLEPSPTKRITMQEMLRHPFLIHQLGPIVLFPYKPHSDAKEINKTVVRYLAFKSVAFGEGQPLDLYLHFH